MYVYSATRTYLICTQDYFLHAERVFIYLNDPLRHFSQNSDCELDTMADSAKSAVHSHENRLTLAHSQVTVL